jgi:uncharacterized MAPEG superfamily protein
MMTDTMVLAHAAILTWVMLIAASLIRSRGWTPDGMRVAFGNRADLPEPTPLAGRADRAAKNMLENLVLFTALVAAAHFAGRSGDKTALGATVFLYARVAYWPIYLAGIPYARTLAWMAAVTGMGMIVAAMV